MRIWSSRADKFLPTLNAAQGRVIAIDPAAPERSHWREIIPQGADTMDLALGSVSLVDHQLIVGTMHDAHNQVRIYGLDGRLRRELSLPGLGSACGFGGELESQEPLHQ